MKEISRYINNIKFELRGFFSFPIFHLLTAFTISLYLVSIYEDYILSYILGIEKINIPSILITEDIPILFLISFAVSYFFGEKLEKKRILILYSTPTTKNQIFFTLFISGYIAVFILTLISDILFRFILHPFHIIPLISFPYLMYIASLASFIILPFSLGVLIAIISKNTLISFFATFISSFVLYNIISFTYSLKMPVNTFVNYQVHNLDILNRQIIMYYQDAYIISLILIFISMIIWRWVDV